jgi:hypothetical protein
VRSPFRPDSIGTIENNCANQNHGFRDIYDRGSSSHRFQALRVISRVSCKAPSHYQRLCFRTARLAPCDGLGPESIPLWQDLFSLLPRHRQSPFCWSQINSPAILLVVILPVAIILAVITRRVLLAIILVAPYSLSSSLPASSSTSYSLRRILLLPNVSFALRATLTMSQSSPLHSSRLPRHHARRVLLASILVAIFLAAILLIDVVLVTSFCTTSQ